MLGKSFARIILLLCVMGLVASVVGCAAKSTPTVRPLSTPVAKVIKFPYDEPPWWREQAARFTEETGIVVDYEVVPFPQLHDRYQTALLSGEYDFDVFHTRDDWTAEWGTMGLLYPLDDLITDEMRADYPPGVLEKLTAVDKATGEKHLYGVGLYYWIWGFYYRTDLFEEAGLEPPETFAEMREMAKELQERFEISGFITALGGSSPTTIFGMVLRGEGGEILTDGRPSFNNQAGLRALENLVGMVKDGTVDSSSFELSSSTKMIDQFIQGRAAMTFATPPTLVMAADPEKSKVVDQVAVALMPGGSVNRSATSHETGSRTIAYNANDPEAAWEYLKYVTQPEQMVEMALALGRVPARKSALNDPRVQEKYPLAAIVAEQLEYPSGMVVVHERSTEISEALARHLTAALRLEMSPEEALAKAEAEILSIIER